MARKTTLPVSKETANRVHKYKGSIGVRSVDEAINQALDEADSGGSSESPVSGERLASIEDQQETMMQAFMELKERVDALDDE